MKKSLPSIDDLPFLSMGDIRRFARYVKEGVGSFPSWQRLHEMSHWSYWRGYRMLRNVELLHLSEDGGLRMGDLLFDQRYHHDLLAGLPAYFGDDDFPAGAAGLWVYRVVVPEAFTMRVKVTDVDDLPKGRDVEESYVVEAPGDEYTEFSADLEREVRDWGSAQSLEALEKKISSAEYWFRRSVDMVYYNDHLAIVRSPRVVESLERLYKA